MTSTPSDPTTGDYPDRDVPEGDVAVGEGSYTDQETEAEKRGEEVDVRGPDDEGEYTDSDVVTEHRPRPPERGYTSTDTGSATSRTSHDDAEEHPHG